MKTPDNEWGIKCCKNCKKAKISDVFFNADYCVFECPHNEKNTKHIYYLYSHYCEDIKL